MRVYQVFFWVSVGVFTLGACAGRVSVGDIGIDDAGQAGDTPGTALSSSSRSLFGTLDASFTIPTRRSSRAKASSSISSPLEATPAPASLEELAADAS